MSNTRSPAGQAPPTFGDRLEEGVRDGSLVGLLEGFPVGAFDGLEEGARDGSFVGLLVGCAVGESDGEAVGVARSNSSFWEHTSPNSIVFDDLKAKSLA